jgi:hypothetical protein
MHIHFSSKFMSCEQLQAPSGKRKTPEKKDEDVATVTAKKNAKQDDYIICYACCQ